MIRHVEAGEVVAEHLFLELYCDEDGCDCRHGQVTAAPRFPQEHREWFEKHGFVGSWDIDEFAVELPLAEHQAQHGGGDWRLGRKWDGEWNAVVWRTLQREEEAKGAWLTREETIGVVEDLMAEKSIPREYVP